VDRPSTPRAPLTRSAAILGLVAAAGAALYFEKLSHLRPPGGDRIALWPLVALGIWAGTIYHVPVRNRQVSMHIGLTGIPVVLALPFLAPGAALSAFFCGRMAGQLQSRKPLDKALINCAVNATDFALGILFYDHALGRSSPTSVWGFAVACVAATIVGGADLVGVVLASAAYNWRWRPPPVPPMVAHFGLDIVISSVGGVTAIVLARAGTWDVVLFALVVAVGDAGWRKAARAAQRHAALHRLYTFTEKLALAEGGERELVNTVLEGARSLLSASRAVLAVPLQAPLDDLMLRCSLQGDGPVTIEEAVARDAFARHVATQGAVVAPQGHPLLERADEVREAVIAPLRPGDAATGYLLVADRPFSHEGFGVQDLELLGMFASNAAAALDRGGLVDKLRHEAAIRDYEARHDPLTRLPNRVLFTDRLEDALRRRQGASCLGLVLIGLDGFKQVNDTLGHGSGDLVLVEVAKRLGPMADDKTLVARLGADEFACLLEDVGSDEDCLTSAAAVLASVATPMNIEGLELIVRASAGTATATEARTTAADLLRQAEVAMHKAKAQGGGARAYDVSSDHAGLRRLTLAGELRRAIDAGSLQVYYQAVASVPSGTIIGFEALARWAHEELGEVPPERFVPVAEKAGLIEPLTWLVLNRALEEVRAWRALLPNLSVSVNFSAISLLKRDLRRRVSEALDASGLPPRALRFELTETSIMAELGKRALDELWDLGVPLSIDDFGTGYSSLSRLRLLPFDEVKIDRSFVANMCRVRDDEAVVASVIELARGLGKVATAEGVEDKATFERLAALGCHRAQGFYLARPLPPQECEALLHAPGARLPFPRSASSTSLGLPLAQPFSEPAG